MEWLIGLIGSVLLPVIFGLWSMHRERKKDIELVEVRFSTIESKVMVLEQQNLQIQKELTEIQKLNEKIERIQNDLIRVITLLEERTSKGP